MNAHLEQLEPTLLWQHFRTFCDTPRPSWHEDAILAKIEAWADQRGLTHERDEANNLLIRKPASPGCENAPGVVLQGHVDMVAEADAGVDHDFQKDPIETFTEDGWLKAHGTTLGADNGIGAAAALAILDETDLKHGPIEVLLTIAEEVSLVGAANLAPNWLSGQLLLNLDTEEEGEVTIGCAGGANVTTETELAEHPLEGNLTVFRVGVHGLTGGHSGMDIDTGRASANRLLARVLYRLLPHGLRLVDYDGGRMDNAITRAAWATVAIPDADFDDATAELVELEAIFKKELAGVDSEVTIGQERAEADSALSKADSKRLIGLLYTLPFGIERMSVAAPGVVETSNNIGVIQIADGVFTAQLMVRSLVDSARDSLVERIATMFELAGFPVTRQRGYPGWAPNPKSDLLARFIDVHAQVAGAKPEVKVIHAGLECGLIGAKYPKMQMISFGPTIRGAHSPTERVDLQAVDNFYRVLRASIADLAER
ncbi:aminoacyl-histidine dipeptidase [Salinisphaera sp. SPP-AMP-43]|uniref:aminoacyl-histidine dipeptidase n=1 Tax=Salinisphaera sp. SPP-AMP-43 TaxID=3121288 RepID=UPI003C6E55B8